MNDLEKRTMLIQRRILGSLCIALVPAVLLFGLFGSSTNPSDWYFSVSATFYANSNIFMIGLIFSTSVFFFSYKGYDWKDRLCSIIQAISLLGIILFPVYNYTQPEVCGIFNLPSNISHILHCITSGIFFAAIGFNLIFLFTITGNEITEKKKLRNNIYRICGILIVISAIIIPINSTSLFDFVPDWFPTTMICEFIMFTSFGFSYIVKSEAISKFNDRTFKEI